MSKKYGWLAMAMADNPYLAESFAFDAKLEQVRIAECGEPLVSLNTAGPHLLVAAGLTGSAALVRGELIAPLAKAAELAVGEGLHLKVVSAYRSFVAQQQRFMARITAFADQYPGMKPDKLAKLANVYTAGKPIFAAHTAGAAVDVLLVDESGDPIDFGVSYPHGGPESATAYGQFDEDVLANRDLLQRVMTEAGFVNYPFEYWHFSIGDACWAVVLGAKEARYGSVIVGDGATASQFLSAADHGLYFSELEVGDES